MSSVISGFRGGSYGAPKPGTVEASPCNARL